jgi:prepilin-type N-terminal cleavage/methylation domain-containing protein
MKINLRRNSGVTLVELMVVVSVIGMLAGISVPNLFKSRASTNLGLIRSNLRQIDNMKQQWALETGAAPAATPVEADIEVYFKGGKMPRAAIGEVYNLNPLTEPASAMIPEALGPLPAGSVILAE